jgi:hypothetical protein
MFELFFSSGKKLLEGKVRLLFAKGKHATFTNYIVKL